MLEAMASHVVSIPVDSQARADICDRGFTRRVLPFDVDISRALAELAHAAWTVPRDQYYESGDRYRSLNRFRARVLEDGVEIESSDDGQPYVQLQKYNTTLGGQERRYSPLPAALVGSVEIGRAHV